MQRPTGAEQHLEHLECTWRTSASSASHPGQSVTVCIAPPCGGGRGKEEPLSAIATVLTSSDSFGAKT